MPTLAIVMLFVLAGPAQRIETEFPDRARVTRVETAMNHLTVIELAEPVTLAAAGSPSFKIERRDNKVFIQPREEGASTNLFIWTGSARWNYELVPAASVEMMHFAVDQQVAASSRTEEPIASPADATSSKSFAEEVLLFGKPIRNHGAKFGSRQVGIFITDAYRKDDQLFIRYMIDNRSTHPYVAVQPEVFSLQSAPSATSLGACRYSHLSPDIEKKIRSGMQTKVATADCDMRQAAHPPGEAATGVLILEAPPTDHENEPTVLRFVFPVTGQKATSLTLVL